MRLVKGRQTADVADNDSQLIAYYRREGWEAEARPPSQEREAAPPKAAPRKRTRRKAK